MKKTYTLLLAILSLAFAAKAQPVNTTIPTTSVNHPVSNADKDIPIRRKLINKSEVPTAVMDAYHRANKDIPVKQVYIYPAYWQTQYEYSGDYQSTSDIVMDTTTLTYAHQYPPETYSNPSNLTKADQQFSAPDYTNGPEYYEMVYTKHKQIYKSVYTKDGTLMHTSRIIKKNELPKKVAMAIRNSEYKNWDVVGEKEKMDKKNPDITIYKIKVRKGEDVHTLHYDQDGNIYKHKKTGL
jgi:hypothetical protein